MNETRAPTNEELRAKVLAEYKKGVGPKALAEKTGISINTIKSWIKRDKDRNPPPKKKPEKKEKGASSPRKRGAPLGNKNAKGNKGGGAPLGNKNALTHGAYSKYWDSLDEDELALLEEEYMDAEEELRKQIQLYTIRERRLMNRIKQYKELEIQNKGFSVSAITKSKDTVMRLDEDGKPITETVYTQNGMEEQRPLFDTVEERTVTHTATIITSIMALEAELTKVQRAKTKAIDSLIRLQNDRRKYEIDEAREQREADLHELQKELLDAQIEHMDASTNKLLGTDVELEDTTDADNLIYGSALDEGGVTDAEEAKGPQMSEE